MKISNPFDFRGFLELDGEYTVGTKSGQFAPSSSGKAEATVPVPWKPDEPFDVMLTLNVKYKLLQAPTLDIVSPMGHMGVGSFGVAAKWRATLSEDGLGLKGKSAIPWGNTKGDGEIAVAASNVQTSESAPKDKKPYVDFEVTIVAGLESQGIKVGFKGVSGTIGGGSKTGGATTILFTLKFEVEKAPPKPAAKKPVVKVLKFKIGPYEHSKTKTEAIRKSSISDYYTWSDFRTAILKLPQATHDEWESKDPQVLGNRTIKITGYADTTGPMSENDLKYGKGRAEDAKKWIQTWTGASDNLFLVKSLGEGKGGTDKKADEKKLALNRYVEVELSYIQ